MSMESNTPVDPRVQIELEKLNTATDNINKYEVELDEAKCDFKRILAESEVRIKQAAHKLGNSIEAAKPYYESRIYAAQLAKETQQAAVNYEKAKSIHSAAKEMVYLAEQGLGEKATLDTACQEMLSHATTKVNQSQVEVTDARNTLKMCQLKLEVANNRVGKLQGQLKQAIRASRPFYEARANYNGLLKAQKQKINELESRVTEAKMTYNEALKNLEQISEDIHRQRQVQRDLLNDTLLPQLCAATTTQSYQHFPREELDAAEEYLQLPAKLSTQSSPVHQRRYDEHECPHLLQDFPTLNLREKLSTSGGMHKSASTSATGDSLFGHTPLHGPYEVKSSGNSSSGGGGTGSGSAHDASSSTGADADDNDDIEQWTEIRLSHSESTSSSYSNQSLLHDQPGGGGAEDAQSHHSSSSSSDEPKRKVTCTTIFHEDQLNKKQSLSQWLSRSNSLKMSGRRQSLDLLIDAGDKVKDVFSFGFQKVGKSLERRNSESEMNAENADGNASGAAAAGAASGGKTSSAGDFFLFSRSSEPKELLSDEQVENLLLNPSLDENGMIIVEQLKSPLQQPNTYGMAATPTTTTTTTTLLF
ncbi:PREDICTED: SH3 domain-binding protein 5-like isoform X2 [Bactrocera latifrons]|uniref:SH3 domain-binding protein 5-like isoform X2 n=1 Tax=Bactrocera latifrons TaxID=174628 RepID=UPI0008DE0CDE|nr:PREDICTED: SH3 domain-binding protein 5-like isoform X2 [Bactrocera latifrons]